MPDIEEEALENCYNITSQEINKMFKYSIFQ